MWTFMLVGTFGAVGAAMAVGTTVALVRYHRTGQWPGREHGAEVTRARLAGLYLRVVVGLALTVYALVSLSDAGLVL